MTLNNHYLQSKFIPAYTKVLRKYVQIYDKYSIAFKHFLSALDALSDARLKHQIIDPSMLERSLRMPCYDLQKTYPTTNLSSSTFITTI